jgi:DHA3 family macrolide efflux protein-like MFS transporter
MDELTGTSDKKKFTGMKGMFLVLFGQTISLLGTTASTFAIIYWAFTTTGKVSTLSWITLSSSLPMILLLPIAGAIVDRSNRKLVMILSDFGAVLSTIFIFTLLKLNMLQPWHLYISGAVVGIFHSFQFPAYSVVISLIIPKKHFARIHALFSFVGAGAGILGPIIAGFLMGLIGIANILLIDFITFLFAIATIIMIYIPQPQQTHQDRLSIKTIFKESFSGITYIKGQKSLLILLVLFAISVFFANLGLILSTPMILKMTSNNAMTLAFVQSSGAVGGLLGALILIILGTITKKKTNGMLLGIFGFFIGMIIFGSGRDPWLWIIGVFIISFFMPIVDALDQAIWQSKVNPAIQGKVFSVRKMLGLSLGPVAAAIAGPLADKLLEPAFGPNGTMGSIFFIQPGVGVGISVLIVLAGVFGFLVALYFAFKPEFRNLEEILEDAV